MKLKAFFSDLDPQARANFAARCKTSIGQIRNVMYGHRSCSVALAALIERNSGGLVTRRELLPADEFMDVWPELAANESQPQEAPHA